MYMKKFFKNNSFYLKSVSAIFLINALIYFGIKLIIKDYNIISTPLDEKIPFVPGFIYIYMIWYPFLIYSFYVIFKYNKEKYIKLILTTILSLLILYIFFIVFPSEVVRPEVNSFHDITSFVIYMVYKTDTPTCCFPSGHCLLCFILLYNLLDNNRLPKKFKYPAIIINILIIISTLLVKQHVIYDVIGSFVLATINYYFVVNLKYFDEIKRKMRNQC